jgi:hypothetical protein
MVAASTHGLDFSAQVELGDIGRTIASSHGGFILNVDATEIESILILQWFTFEATI